MKQRIILCGIAMLFLAVAVLAIRGFLRSRSDQSVPVKSMDTWQQADAPLGYPLNIGETTEDGKNKPQILPPFDPRFIQLSAFELTLLPTITATSYPMGSEHGALTYNAQPFWELNTKRNGNHTGDDFNGIGGMNTDLGDPIYAIANGLVVYRGEPSLGWGNTIILAHRTPQGSTLLSMYSHLDKVYSALGSILSRGDIIGTVGTANQNYPAHLHLEMHDSSGIHIGAGYTYSSSDRIDPSVIIASNQQQTSDLPLPVFSIMTRELLEKKHESIRIKNISSEKK